MAPQYHTQPEAIKPALGRTKKKNYLFLGHISPQIDEGMRLFIFYFVAVAIGPGEFFFWTHFQLRLFADYRVKGQIMHV